MKKIAALIISISFVFMANSYAEEGKKKKRKGPSAEMRETLKNMTDAERQAFKAEMKAKRQANGEGKEGGKKGEGKKGGKCDKKKDSAAS
ncbi:MAG: hypothetical protein MK132_25440 [Lentisphaerales bacterium]|nr:hypothetical protein [Lentisphaerales bacterium]